MGAFYHTKRVITSASATTEASGYPASNAGLESIRRPWRSTSLIETTVVLNIASATAAAVLLTDVNFASATIKNAADATLGTLTSAADKLTGRRRGLLVAAIAATTAIKVVIPAGTPTDGAAFWKIGAAYIFATGVTLPRDPENGCSLESIFPKLSTELPNGQIAEAALGDDVLVLTLPFKREYNEDGLELARRARAATIGLAINTDNYPELCLPVRFRAGRLAEQFPVYRVTESTVPLRETT